MHINWYAWKLWHLQTIVYVVMALSDRGSIAVIRELVRSNTDTNWHRLALTGTSPYEKTKKTKIKLYILLSVIKSIQ